MPDYRYRVRYLTEPGGRVKALRVVAPDADAARGEARRIDPAFLATPESPRRLAPYPTEE